MVNDLKRLRMFLCNVKAIMPEYGKQNLLNETKKMRELSFESEVSETDTNVGGCIFIIWWMQKCWMDVKRSL